MKTKFKLFLLIIVNILLFNLIIFSQNDFAKFYTNPDYLHDDYDLKIIKSYDNEYILTGLLTIKSITKAGIFLIKTDSTGNLIWSKVIGNFDWIYEGWDIIQTSDSNIVLTGAIVATPIYTAIIKLDKNGDLIWSKKYQSTNELVPATIIENSQGDYVMAGCDIVNGKRDVAFLKIDKDGAVKSFKRIQDTLKDVCNLSIFELDNGEYFMGGYTHNYDTIVGSEELFFLAKVDSVGNKIFTKNIYFNFITGVSTPIMVKNKKTNTYLITTTTYFNSDQRPIYINLNDNGAISWAKILENQLVASMRYTGLNATEDGGYLLKGMVFGNPMGLGLGVTIIKLDSLGNIAWIRTIGESNVEEIGSSQRWGITCETKGGNVVALTIRAPFLDFNLDTTELNLVRINQDGTQNCFREYNFTFTEYDTIPVG